MFFKIELISNNFTHLSIKFDINKNDNKEILTFECFGVKHKGT